MPAHAAGYSSTDRYRQSLRRLVHRDRDPVPVRAVGGVHRAVPARAFSPARGEGDVIEHGVVTKRVVRWVFDELPPSGARRGGDPSEHAFRRDLESLVREVVQNANDQAEFLPRVTFRVRELCGEALEAYLRAAQWETLEPHLEGASRAKGGAALRSFLRAFRQQRRLVLLEIEDRNTRGLTGAESEGESHFRALCKDTLYSHKASKSAGGSYGLGKSVLWTFSGLSTVLFNSVLVDDPRAGDSPRLIGRTELPSHATASGRWYTGSGWFGNEARVPRQGVRAESLWAGEAISRAEALHIDRGPTAPPGTTIQIVGFRDPTREPRTREQLTRDIEDASVRFFWPAMISERKMGVLVQDAERPRRVEVDTREVAPFLDAYRRRGDPQASLERPGDVVVRSIAVEVPSRRDGAPATTGQVDLVVRLARESERNHARAGQVAMFRGPGMVIRYWDCRALSLGARTFHALLLAGEARNPDAPSAEDSAVERFLRAAEPPGHDEWCATPALRQAYKRGGPTALQRLHRRIREVLKQLLAPRLTQGKKGPDRLQRRFPIGPRGSKGGTPSAFRFSRLSAHFDTNRWHFSGVIEPVKKARAWKAIVRLMELGDEGAPLGELAIERLELEEGQGASVLRAGAGYVTAADDVRSLAFTGYSTSLPSGGEPPAELRFEVTGVLEGSA